MSLSPKIGAQREKKFKIIITNHLDHLIRKLRLKSAIRTCFRSTAWISTSSACRTATHRRPRCRRRPRPLRRRTSSRFTTTSSRVSRLHSAAPSEPSRPSSLPATGPSSSECCSRVQLFDSYRTETTKQRGLL